jgi:hypothetical protein
MHKVRAAVRVASAILSGEMLLNGQRIPFEAAISPQKIDATFADLALDGSRVDHWLALRALETFIDEHLGG